jgi:glucose/arabinose dehydrogenase
LGLDFFGETWPEEYRGDLLVAMHGSWNRTEPSGYNLTRYQLDEEGNYLGEESFISGWLQGKSALGRPVDVSIRPGGLIYISDDKAGVIYRVNYHGNNEK